eukprot:6484864-Amphidinium_carterae.2
MLRRLTDGLLALVVRLRRLSNAVRGTESSSEPASNTVLCEVGAAPEPWTSSCMSWESGVSSASGASTAWSSLSGEPHDVTASAASPIGS